MIQIESLHKHYGAVHALDGLNMTVEPGVVYGFLGPNGAGKTTTLRILAGLARPTSGRVVVAGVDLTFGRPYPVASHRVPARGAGILPVADPAGISRYVGAFAWSGCCRADHPGERTAPGGQPG